MDSNCEGSTHIVELGPATLGCLRDLIAAIDRLIGQEPSSPQHQQLPSVSTIPSLKESPFLDAEQAAAYLGTTVSSLYGLVERRQIEPMRGPRRRYRFTKEILDGYLKRGRRS